MPLNPYGKNYNMIDPAHFFNTAEYMNQLGIKKADNPAMLMNNIAPTALQGFSVAGNRAGITSLPGQGAQVGLYGLNNLQNLYSGAQNMLGQIMPSLGSLTNSDMTAGQSLSNYLFNQGKGDLDKSLNENINKFREDAFRRGLGASSSMLSGMRNLYESNADALGSLRSNSDMQGLQYAWDLANQRTQAADFLSGLNSDLYRQINEVPLNIASGYTFKQADLEESNKGMNLDRLSQYYGLVNDATNAFNTIAGELGGKTMDLIPEVMRQQLEAQKLAEQARQFDATNQLANVTPQQLQQLIKSSYVWRHPQTGEILYPEGYTARPEMLKKML